MRLNDNECVFLWVLRREKRYSIALMICTSVFTPLIAISYVCFFGNISYVLHIFGHSVYLLQARNILSG